MLNQILLFEQWQGISNHKTSNYRKSNDEKVKPHMEEKSMYVASRDQVPAEFQSHLQVKKRFVGLSDNRSQAS